MNIREKSIGIVKKKYESIRDWLNEKSRRIWAATEAEALGYGGLTIVREATGIDYHTIRKGINELGEKKEPDTVRIRKKGGGRKRLTEKQPDILRAIENIVDTSGEAESPLLRTCKSSYKIAEELEKQGYDICQKSVHTILRNEFGIKPSVRQKNRRRKRIES